MQTSTFTYDSNETLNLICGLFIIGLGAFYLYNVSVPNFSVLGWRLVAQIGLFLMSLLFLWLGFYMINRFRKLHGEKRSIIFSDKNIRFPEFADSLNMIELDFSKIEQIYFDVNRYNDPHNLIIKYDNDRLAYIGRNELLNNDFEKICDLFKLRLGLNTIETKSA